MLETLHYIESSAGVAAGGRTGVTAIVTGILFFLSLFIAQLVGAIPSFATAPALIFVRGLMLTGLGTIEWDNPQIGIPAFLTVATIPLTWSIADGLSFGLTSYAPRTRHIPKRLDALSPRHPLPPPLHLHRKK
jgi:AGZA family xanthine/uracil permease-like MFS transporter